MKKAELEEAICEGKTTLKKELKKKEQQKQKAWIRMLCHKIGLGFHPDTDFNDYVDNKDNRAYTEKEANLLNERMKRAFKVLGSRIYDIGAEKLQKAMNKRQPKTKKGKKNMATKKTTKKATKKVNLKGDKSLKKAKAKRAKIVKGQSKKKANNKKGTGKSIRKSIIDLMMTKGVDSVTNEQCEKIAKGIKKDTAWKSTHFYYYRKVVKGMIAEQKTKRTKKNVTKRNKKTSKK